MVPGMLWLWISGYLLCGAIAVAVSRYPGFDPNYSEEVLVMLFILWPIVALCVGLYYLARIPQLLADAAFEGLAKRRDRKEAELWRAQVKEEEVAREKRPETPPPPAA